MDTAAQLGTGRRNLACNCVPPRGETGNHGTITRQVIRIGVGMGDHHRVLARFEAVPDGHIAGLQAERLHRNTFGPMQGDDTMGRSYETHAGPARNRAVLLQLVGHHLGDGQPLDGGLQRTLQTAANIRARHHGGEVQERVLAVLLHK